ncbi:MAG: Crp/Fnr family transcriptional regulator [Salibacteraceae bacterium]|nr:Crp/Fnr family transcriptional regulator [Salibacteraceae bacterium]|tara:strand:- start:36110 stop:36820 length:711 start_codon:yes stop_codon:yes gene_type:complete
MKRKTSHSETMQNSEIEEILFGGIDLSRIEEIHKNSTQKKLKKNQIIFLEGTRPLGVYSITSGRIKIYKTGVEGKDQIIQILKSGDLMGYRAMLSEEQYPVSAETLEETTLCFIPKKDFIGAMSSNSDLTKEVIKSLSKDLTNMADSITVLAQKPVRERLAGALMVLIDTYDIDESKGVSNGINLTREDLANMVGTATETLIRLLHDFKYEQLIETQGRKILIKNKEKLKKVANLI